MDDNAKYKVSAKRLDTGKWWTFGSLAKNKWNNWSIGMKMTPELRALLASKQDGDWINFSLFEDESNPAQQNQAPITEPELDQNIPF